MQTGCVWVVPPRLLKTDTVFIRIVAEVIIYFEAYFPQIFCQFLRK